MIANTSSGKRFGPLASYLVAGRSGTETDRVAWTSGRNLGTDDPALAAPLMQATARHSALVQVPVYHLTISFDHQDRVTPQQMQVVADRVLRDLGLAEHQALMVAHKDRQHAHVHVMVNRIHPDTGIAWERWQDRPKIERALREEERVLGLRQVAGRLHQIDGPDSPGRAANSPDARRQADQRADAALVERVRAALPEMRVALSWEDLTARLTEHGLRVEGKGQGLVFTDGTKEVKASRVARDLSLRRLEERFGTPYPTREQLSGSRVHAEAPLSPAALAIAATARELERVDTLQRAQSQLERDRVVLRSQRDDFQVTVESVASARAAFDRALTSVYRDPSEAHQAISESANTVGPERVRVLLCDQPERFGDLRTVEEARAFGLLTVHNDAGARDSARRAAVDWHTLTEREVDAATRAATYVQSAERRFREALVPVYRAPIAASAAIESALQQASAGDVACVLAQSPDRLGALRAPGTPVPVSQVEWAVLAERARHAIDARQITSSELAHAHANQALSRTETRSRELRTALANAPSHDLLRHSISRVVDQLEPRELTKLRRVLTSPQAALVFKAHTAVRDTVLGRDERER